MIHQTNGDSMQLSRNRRGSIFAATLFSLGIATLAGASQTKSALSEQRVSQAEPQVVTRVYPRIPRLPLRSYVSVATDAVRGRIVGQRAVFPAGQAGYTEILLAVDETVLGTAAGVITIRVGGADGPGPATIVAGAPSFQQNEEVVLFLNRYGNFYGITGLADGTYRVQTMPGGQPHVSGLHTSNEEGVADFTGRVRSLASQMQQRHITGESNR